MAPYNNSRPPRAVEQAGAPLRGSSVDSGVRRNVVPAGEGSYLVDPASSHMLVSKIKPCMSMFKQSKRETAHGSLQQRSPT